MTASKRFGLACKLEHLFFVLCIVILIYFHVTLSIYYPLLKPLSRALTWLGLSEDTNVGPQFGSLDDEIFYKTLDETNCTGPFFNLYQSGICPRWLRAADYNSMLNGSLEGTLDFSRVILIVSFNRPHFETLPKIYRLYRNLFLKIVYCVTGISDLDNFQNGTYLPLVNKSIIEFMPEPTNPTGESFYKCIPDAVDKLSDVAAMLKDNQTDGLLHISDDLIANLWQFKAKDLDLKNAWAMGPAISLYDIDTMHHCNGDTRNNSADCLRPEDWPVLRQYQKQLNACLTEAEMKYPDYYSNLTDISGGPKRAWNIYADLFYVSREYISKSLHIFRLFSKHRIYMELAVGTILKGIVNNPPSRLQFIYRGGQISGAARSMNVTETFNSETWIFHPFKMGNVQHGPVDVQCLFCALVESFDRLRVYKYQRSLLNSTNS